MTSNSKCGDRYIYQLPYAQHQELCRILDRDVKWEELGGKYMNFDMNTIIDLRRDDQRGRSPTSQLLTMWGQQNHTVVQLFVLLSKMHHYQAMTVLKPLVDSRYHPLINEGEENVSLFFDKENDASTADSNQHEQNTNDNAGNGGAVPHSNSSMDKNMNVWDNLNRRDTPCDAGHEKVLLPPEQPEAKILNKPMPLGTSKSDSNQDNINIPQVAMEVPRSGLSPAHSPQPVVQNTGAKLRSEGKENDPSTQERKKSSASPVAESIPLISYLELESATRVWDKKNIVGKGGFGTVFKGNWKNTCVAIKRLEQKGPGATKRPNKEAQMEQLLQELRILNSCRHDNILPLYGFSMDGVDPCLVYQFMPNGSLEDRLLCRQETPPLSWIQRHNIARGTARGLQFLHVKPFVHGDIKSANILLDKNFEPRIGDFGLARDGPQGHYTHMQVSRIHGTLAYLPSDFLRNKQLSTKVDTYSFGIVIFELATGLRAYDDRRPQKMLREFVLERVQNDILHLHDKKPGPVDHFVFEYMMELAKICVRELPRERPEMEEVLKSLEAHYRVLVERVHYMTPKTLPFQSPVPQCAPRIIVVSPEPPHAPVMPVPGGLVSPVPHLAFPCPRPMASPVPAPYITIPQDGNVPVLDIGPEESHSSLGSSEEVGAATSAVPAGSSPSIPPSNAVLPLLSALGTVDNEDTRDTTPPQTQSRSLLQDRQSSGSSCKPEITAKGKPFLCGDLSN